MVVSVFAHPLHDFSLSSLSFLSRSLSLCRSLLRSSLFGLFIFLTRHYSKRTVHLDNMGKKEEKGEQKKNYSIVADHYMYTIVLCPIK
jgi:hypothetical protein